MTNSSPTGSTRPEPSYERVLLEARYQTVMHQLRVRGATTALVDCGLWSDLGLEALVRYEEKRLRAILER